MPIRNRFAELQPEIAALRRDFHAHPELRFEETRTAGIVADRLRSIGCDEVVEGVGKTGVVGVIRGRRSGSGRVVGFRADMDALPIREQTGAPHASTETGKMHACGHDGHTAMLLGAAQYLAETRQFDGTVVLIFQPAEEGGGGAKAMIADGLMDRWAIDEVYGMHNWPGLAPGRFAVRAGAQLAAADFFRITVRGKGGHGALPHLAVDTTLAAAQVVAAVQSIAARNIDPLRPAVISICSIRSDTDAFNVIPDKVVLKGTTRYLDAQVQELMETRLREVAEATAAAYGATAKLSYHPGVLPTINTPEMAEAAAAAAEQVSGEALRDFPPSMGGEDFADMLAVRPGAFAFIGNGDSADLHNPNYEFNDEAIPAGASWFATLAEMRMPLG